MDAFSYLSVLISLILGLAITQVLQGLRGLMQARTRVVVYWPTIVWAILIIVISVQSWWSMFGMREHLNWTFLEFAIVLLQTTVLYLLAALVVPDAPTGTEPIDLCAHYVGQRRWFFALLASLILVSLAKQILVFHEWPRRADLAFHFAFLTLSAAAAFVRSPRAHAGFALAGSVLIVSYIAMLFTHLQ